jgi:23S rRNA pseudouridine2605 synthase
MAEAGGERLQKVLARAGVGSRRTVERLIEEGRVMVNGEPARLGRRIESSKDVVEVDGLRVPLAAGVVHYLMNKPVGVVTTARDDAGRPTAIDLIDAPVRVWPVGRLDADTEGALIVTNDGDLTHRLTHPRFGVPKTYLAEVRGAVKRTVLRQLATGVALDDGTTAPARVGVAERREGSTLVEITITEGRNRQVRRMFEACGHPVVRLARIAIGPVRLGRLKPGTVRRLSPVEVAALWGAVASSEEDVAKYTSH